MVSHQVGKEDVIVESALRGQANQARQRTGDGNHSHVGCGCPALSPQQQPETERLVDDPGKGMRRIHGDRGQQGVKFAGAILVHESARLGIQFVEGEHANPLGGQAGPQQFVPAAILLADQFVGLFPDGLGLCGGREAVGPGIGIAVFNLL
jgi:hypothetical protein